LIVALLILLGFAWLLVLTALVLDLAGIMRRGTARRLQGLGMLVAISPMLVRQFLEYRGWSATRLTAFDTTTGPIIPVGIVLLVIGLVLASTERKASRSPQRERRTE
jgi:hypothetical protein